MLSAFTGVLHVPNLSQPEHVMAVLEESDAFSKQDLQKIQHDIRGARYVDHKSLEVGFLKGNGVLNFVVDQ